MKIQIAGLAVAVLCLAGAAQVSAQQSAAAPDKIVATIDATQTGVPVSQYEYGMFIEHIGGTMYGSLSAQLLDDRKFYFPIVSKDPESQASRQGNPMRMQMRKWRPVGPDEVVVMDKDNPFVGDQSPRIALEEPQTPHGIRQAGLALVSGKKYTGRIYLRGTPGARVHVALVWGSGPNDRQAISITALTSEYKKYPLAFTSGADSDRCRARNHRNRHRQLPHRHAFAHARGQHRRLPRRHHSAHPPDQIRLLALWRQLHLEPHLVPHYRRSR